MAKQQPSFFKIFCLIHGENTPFSVNIQRSETVNDLKKAINGETELVPKERSRHLERYLINLPDGRDMEERVNKRPHAEPPLDWLIGTMPLDEVLSGTFSLNKVHILIKVSEISE
jgi:hypothetical protein